MQTSRFQLGLIATLAVGLGLSLASSEAVGYPAGAAVSYGSNPVWNTAMELGYVSGSTVTVDIVSAPSDQDAMLTDVLAATNSSGIYFTLQLDDGTHMGKYSVHATSGSNPRGYQYTFDSPLVVPAGRTLSLAKCTGCPEMWFTMSGYYAQP